MIIKSDKGAHKMNQFQERYMLIGAMFAGTIFAHLLFAYFGIMNWRVAVFACFFWALLVVGCAWAFWKVKDEK